MSNVTIRFALKEDAPLLSRFIAEHWSLSHIFAKHEDILLTCHDVGLEHLTYAMAQNDAGNIVGLCGYIPSNQNVKPHIWIALWKVLKTDVPALGLRLLDFVRRQSNCSFMACCGINTTVMKLYQRLGYITGTLEHYYKLGTCTDYRIAVIGEKPTVSTTTVEDVAKFVRFRSYSDLSKRFDSQKYTGRKPYKDTWYLNWRYFNHFKYEYLIYGIDKGGNEIDSLLVGREISCNSATVFRVVDFIGLDNDLRRTSSAFEWLIKDGKYEYIDFYQYGISEEVMNAAGFTRRGENDPNIIPNYFEPFEQKNVDIHFFYEKCEDFHIYKADGDQDRPNRV